MKALLKFQSVPFSINKAYYKNRTRTKENRKWADGILEQLMDEPNSAELLAFKNHIESTKEFTFIEITIIHLHPAKNFFTSTNDINIRTMDLTNIEKLLVDLLFDKRHHGRTTNSGTNIVNLEYDDKRNILMHSGKSVSRDGKHEILISLESHKNTKVVQDLVKEISQ